MAKIKNTLQFDFQEKGSQRVAKGTETVTKAQTRLGQASASAGRQFSAQATGLGGIVSAYAGAAANIFALTAAFFALQRSAEFEQIISGTQQLASTIGESGQNIITTVQAITKSQLSLLEAAQQVNLGLSAGFNTQQISELSEVSLRASKALGRNLSDAFQRVVRGAAKLEPELLDELGIFTRIDPAVRKYADSIGVSVTSLSNFERRQAFVNAVIEEGQRKFRDVDTSTDTAAQSLSRLSATIVDLGLKLGGFLANVLGPFADFLTNNTSNAIALFGLLARVIGAQAISVFGNAINEVATNIQKFGDVTSAALNKSGAAFQAAQQEAAEFSAGKQLLTRFGTQAEQQIKSETRAVIQDIQAKKLLTKEELANARATLTAAKATEQAFIARNKQSKNVKLARAAIANLTEQIVLLEKQEKKASVAGNIFALSLRGIGKAAAFVGATLSKFLGIITTITLALSLFQLAADALGSIFGFGEIKILETILKFIKDIIDSFRGSARSIKAFGTAFTEEIDKIFKNSGKNIEEQKKSVDAANKALQSLVALQGETPGTKAFNLQSASFRRVMKTIRESGDVEALEIIKLFKRELEGLNREFGRKEAFLFITNLREISAISGVSGAALTKALKGTNDLFNITIMSGNKLAFVLGNTKTILGTLTKDGFQLKEGFEDGASALLTIGKLSKQFSDDLAAGSLTGEKSAAAIQARENAIQRLIRASLKIQGTERDTLEGIIRRLQIDLELDRVTARRLKNLEKENKLFEKVFGRPIEKLEQSMLRGDIDQNRNVATTAEEKLANQAQLLLKLTKGREKAVADMSVEMQSQVSQLEVMKTNLKDMVLEQDNLIKKGESSRRLNKEIFDLRNRITLKEQNIAKLTSVQQEELKKGRDSLAQLLIIQRGFEASVEKTVFNLQKQALQLKIRALDTDIKIAEVGRKERLANEKAITAELKAQNDAQQQFLKGIGGLNRFEELEFLRERVKNEKSLAKVTRDVQKERAQGDLDRANKRLELDILTTNRQIQVTIDQIESTLDLIEVLNNVGEELNNLANELSGKKSTFNKVPVQERREFLFGGEKDKAGGVLGNIKKELEETLTELQLDLKTLNTAEFNLKVANADRIFNLAVRNADRELSFAEKRNSLSVRLFTRFNKVLTSSITDGLDSLFDAIAAGELTLKNFREGFNQFLFNLLNDIRKQFLRETLTEPLANFGTSILKSAFGITGGAQPRLGIGENMGQLAGDASGGLVPNTLVGSLQKLAAGGSPRDRVPALLEPGEFVMQRKAVNAMGLPAMQQINAGGMPPISVSINNEGTPQEATEATPRFDVDKIVIDVVTRDLRNNGPIRKSLRGGGNA